MLTFGRVSCVCGLKGRIIHFELFSVALMKPSSPTKQFMACARDYTVLSEVRMGTSVCMRYELWRERPCLEHRNQFISWGRLRFNCPHHMQYNDCPLSSYIKLYSNFIPCSSSFAFCPVVHVSFLAALISIYFFVFFKKGFHMLVLYWYCECSQLLFTMTCVCVCSQHWEYKFLCHLHICNKVLKMNKISYIF